MVARGNVHIAQMKCHVCVCVFGPRDGRKYSSAYEWQRLRDGRARPGVTHPLYVQFGVRNRWGHSLVVVLQRTPVYKSDAPYGVSTLSDILRGVGFALGISSVQI